MNLHDHLTALFSWLTSFSPTPAQEVVDALVDRVIARVRPAGWQLFLDETHGRGAGDWYSSSDRVDQVGNAGEPPDGFEPMGPWEPLGNGEWRRPLRRTA